MLNKKYDVAIVGLGAVGSAAAYQLSQTNISVIGFEQFGSLHTEGSYHGDTRITRQALGEGEYYVPLALRSQEIWRELETKTGEDLFTECGALITAFGAQATREDDFFQTTIAASIQHNIQHELLDNLELKRRFNKFRYQEDEVGYFESNAGFVRPERCVSVQQKLASQAGAVLHFDTAVNVIEKIAGGGVRITTNRGSYEVSQIIISVGSGIHHFLPETLQQHFNLYRQVLYWFEPERNYLDFNADRCPVYIRIGGSQPEEMYGFPSIDGIGGGLKMATENFTLKTSIDNIDREITASETQKAFDIFSQYIALKPECVKSTSCIYTATEDYDFVIDFLPDFPECLILSPCSGHGFKHSAAIGEIAAQLVSNGKSNINLSPFSLTRFD